MQFFTSKHFLSIVLFVNDFFMKFALSFEVFILFCKIYCFVNKMIKISSLWVHIISNSKQVKYLSRFLCIFFHFSSQYIQQNIWSKSNTLKNLLFILLLKKWLVDKILCKNLVLRPQYFWILKKLFRYICHIIL